MNPSCGLSFKAWTIFTVSLEILLSGAIILTGGWAFASHVGKHARLTYTPAKSTHFVENNNQYTILVTTWILMLIAAMTVARIICSILLAIGVRKSSTGLAKFWIVFKVFSVMMSLFLVTASFTVSLPVKAAALISVITDLVAVSFIRVLYPELDRMRKFVVIDSMPTETTEKENDSWNEVKQQSS